MFRSSFDDAWETAPDAFGGDLRQSLATVLIVLLSPLAVASAFEWARIEWRELMVHLYLFLLVPSFLATLLWRRSTVPSVMYILAGGALVCVVLPAAIGPQAQFMNYPLKWVASFVTIMLAAQLVRTRANFRVACVSLALAGAVLAVWGLFWFASVGRLLDELVETGNKNALSVYLLPCLVLGIVALRTSGRGLGLLLLLASCLSMAGAMLSSRNRSGWIGLAVVGLLLLRARWTSPRSLVLLAACIGALYGGMEWLGTTAIFTERYTDTFREVDSQKNVRPALIAGTWELCLESPWVGVSPQDLPRRLSLKVQRHPGLPRREVLSHFQPLDLLAAYGLLGTVPLAVFLATLFFYERRRLRRLEAPADRVLAQALPFLLVVWLVRGLFTAEMVFAPVFNLAIGYAFGIRLILSRERRAREGFMVAAGDPDLGDIVDLTARVPHRARPRAPWGRALP